MKMPKLKFKIPALTVRGRLRLVLGMLMLMLVAGAVIGIGSMQLQNEGMRSMYQDELVTAQTVSRMRADSLMQFIVLGEAARLVKQPPQLKQKMDEYAALEKKFLAEKKEFDAAAKSDAVAAQYKKYLADEGDYISGLKDMTDALNQHDEAAGDVLDMEVRPLMMMRLEVLDKLVSMQRDEAFAAYQDQVSRFKLIRAISIGALAAGLLLAMWMALSLSRSIISTLTYAGRVAREIAQGKLGHAIQCNRKDELGQLLEAVRSMDERLSAIVGEVRHGSGAVSTAAQQIARGNDDLSQRTQEQASSLEETASSMEEMTSTVKQNAENASHANQLARGAREQAERGGEVASQAVVAMKEINASSRKISDIVSLIDEIAFQTNLLSLNAAVEAARAGEQGRGFAVVATEVRNLSQRSAAAAREIKALIGESVERVQVGSRLVDQSGTALKGIVESVRKVTDIVAEIAAASQEQSAGIDQVNRAVTQMDEVTQQNAALVEEASAAARAMQDQAAGLRQQMLFFRLDGDSAGVHAQPEAVVVLPRAAAPRREPMRAVAAAASAWTEF